MTKDVQPILPGDIGPDPNSFPIPVPLSGHGPARVTAMCNQKGDVGRTMTTTSLGAALAEYGRKALIVDFDPQGAASVGLGINTLDMDQTIYTLLMNPKVQVESSICPTCVEGLDVIPANIGLSAAEVQLVTEVARESVLTCILRHVEDDYDIILIDHQPSLSLLAVNALTTAHGVIVPVEMGFFALRGVVLLMETIETVRDRINPRLKIDGIVPTMVDSRTLHSHEALERLNETFDDLVFMTKIARTMKFPDASAATEPITTYALTHPGAQAYRRLVRELIARGDAAWFRFWQPGSH